MDDSQQLLALANWFDQNLDHIWTFVLLFTRYTILINFIPGLGQGAQGQYLRQPGVMVVALAATGGSPLATMPVHWFEMFAMILSEAILGAVLGLIPHLVVSGIQTGGMLSSTTMGLGAGQLFDPTLGTQTTSLARIMADLTIIFFLTMGGHHWLIYSAAGLDGVLVPGTFMLTVTGLDQFVHQSARIFAVGALISAPVIVALLLTQFVMGLITKAVPQVNIFIVSFPVTIGVGLILTALSLGDIMVFVEKEFRSIEPVVLSIIGME
jgi:flagellar biosynthetic protein FliR